MKLKLTTLNIFATVFLLNLFIPELKGQTGTLVTTVEAENGVFTGSVAKSTSMAGYTGTGYATNFWNTGDKVTVTVNVPSKAFYEIYIRYHSDYKKQYVSVNGGGASEIEFVNTGSSWSVTNAGKYIFNAGSNTITLEKSWGWCDIDNFKVYTTTLNSYTEIVPSLNDSNATVAAKSLYNYMLYQFQKRIISGQTDGAYFDTIKSITGNTPLYRTWDFSHYTEGYPYLWKNGGFSFGIDVNDKSTENAINWYKNNGRKGLVGFQWHWFSPGGGTVGTNTFYSSNTTFDVTKAVQSGTTENILIIRDIDAIAVQLKKLQTENVPVLWRPLHEAGGAWFWWGAKGATACKQLWYILYDRLMNYHKLHNLIWVWSSPEAAWYPGNNTVDIIGFDSYPGNYNYGSQKFTFDQLFNVTQGTKIIAMSENGPIPDPDECLDYDAPWSLFMSWADLVKSQNSRQHIKDVYANHRVLTLENDTFPVIITAQNGEICDSGTVVLTATSNFGEVRWYASSNFSDTAIYTGTSFTTPKLYSSQTFFVDASYNGKTSGINRIPVKAIVMGKTSKPKITGEAKVCKPASGLLFRTNKQPNAKSYVWTLPTGVTGTSGLDSIKVNFTNSAISGNILVSAQNVCGAGVADTLMVTVNATPATPAISQLGDTLYASTASEYQWYFNSGILTGSVSDTCRVIKSGNYYVIVVENGCYSLPSNVIAATVTSTYNMLNPEKAEVFPNPTSGKVTVKIMKQKKNSKIAIFDATGRKVKVFTLVNDKEQELDLTSLPAGVYVIQVNSDVLGQLLKN